jgi:hypothetical protein
MRSPLGCWRDELPTFVSILLGRSGGLFNAAVRGGSGVMRTVRRNRRPLGRSGALGRPFCVRDHPRQTGASSPFYPAPSRHEVHVAVYAKPETAPYTIALSMVWWYLLAEGRPPMRVFLSVISEPYRTASSQPTTHPTQAQKGRFLRYFSSLRCLVAWFDFCCDSETSHEPSHGPHCQTLCHNPRRPRSGRSDWPWPA